MLVKIEDDIVEKMENANDNLMSNFDHKVNKEIEQQLKENYNLKADYPGWNFFGECWYKDDSFYCRVKCYRETVGYYKANTPEELMEEISNIYGYE